MPLLIDEDYSRLAEQGIKFCEDDNKRFLILQDYRLPAGLYQVQSCDVLIQIPSNYNQAGNDMFWTYPRLKRANGIAIPATNEPGAGNNSFFRDKEFCRWSRHWNQGRSVWKPGADNVGTIVHRVEWALGNPDAK